MDWLKYEKIYGQSSSREEIVDEIMIFLLFIQLLRKKYFVVYNLMAGLF